MGRLKNAHISQIFLTSCDFRPL